MSALYTLLGTLVVLTGVLTGYRIWEKRSRQNQGTAIAPPAIERSVEAPPAPVEPAIGADVAIAATAAKPNGESVQVIPPPPLTQSPDIPDPWLSEEESAAVAKASAHSPAVETTDPPPDQAPIPADLVRAVVEAPIAPPATPSQTAPSPSALTESIARIGHSRQLHQAIALVRYVNHADGQVRATTATALGNLAANRPGTRTEAFIPLLGKLSQDPKVEVRVAAVTALGQVRSPKVLPWLQRSQNQPDARVRRAAAVALQRLKLNYQAALRKPQAGKEVRRK